MCQIQRGISFESNLPLGAFPIDRYLQAATAKDSTDCNCLVRILQPRLVPLRYSHQILGEAAKIMRFMSHADCTEPVRRYVHRVHDIFQIGHEHIYMLFEPLTGCCSLSNLVRAQLLNDKLPPIRANQDGQILSLENVRKWIRQLANTVYILASHGLSHRHIRAEFIFISVEGDAKLSHFDMACFAWNASSKQIVKRSRGLQDELDQQWDHLPPECFETRYECLLVDVWSTGVLLIFCLIGQSPFTVPMTSQSALQQWLQWKQSPQGTLLARQLDSLISVLNQVFVPILDRINSEMLIALLTPAAFKLTQSKSKSADRTRIVPGFQANEANLIPKEANQFTSKGNTDNARERSILACFTKTNESTNQIGQAIGDKSKKQK